MPTKSTTQTTKMTTTVPQIDVIRAELIGTPTAMKFVSIGLLPMTDIREAYGQNVNRATGVMEKGVLEFIECIRGNEYRPEHYVPPVVVRIPEGDSRQYNDEGITQYFYELVSGHHRYHAHRGLNLATFYAQVVEFLPTNGKTARSWMLTYQAQENNPSKQVFVRNVSTIDDVANSITSILNETTFSPEDLENEVELAISTIGIVGDSRKQAVRNKVLENRGLNKLVVQSITAPIREKLNQIHANTHSLNTEHIIHGGFTKVNEPIHDYRTLHQVWSAIEFDPTCVDQLHVVGSTTKANSAQVVQIRKKKERLLKDHAQQVLDRAAFLLGVPKSALLKLKKGTNLEKFSTIPMYWTPQLDQEDEEFSITGEFIQTNPN